MNYNPHFILNNLAHLRHWYAVVDVPRPLREWNALTDPNRPDWAQCHCAPHRAPTVVLRIVGIVHKWLVHDWNQWRHLRFHEWPVLANWLDGLYQYWEMNNNNNNKLTIIRINYYDIFQIHRFSNEKRYVWSIRNEGARLSMKRVQFHHFPYKKVIIVFPWYCNGCN